MSLLENNFSAICIPKYDKIHSYEKYAAKFSATAPIIYETTINQNYYFNLRTKLDLFTQL